jgi:hypothetical protein
LTAGAHRSLHKTGAAGAAHEIGGRPRRDGPEEDRSSPSKHDSTFLSAGHRLRGADTSAAAPCEVAEPHQSLMLNARPSMVRPVQDDSWSSGVTTVRPSWVPQVGNLIRTGALAAGIAAGSSVAQGSAREAEPQAAPQAATGGTAMVTCGLSPFTWSSRTGLTCSDPSPRRPYDRHDPRGPDRSRS